MSDARSINAILIGIGNMGKVAAKCMLDHQINIAAVVDIDKELIGKDIGTILDTKKTGIIVEDNLDHVLENHSADIAIVATETAVDDISEIVEKCVRKGMNVGTTSEEAFYPWQTAKDSALRLDKLAKENNVSIFGSGIQDVFYLNICQVLAGACNDIKSIDCYNFLPLDDMGAVVAEEMFLGKTKEEYDRSIEESGGVNPLAEDTLTTAYAVAASLGLHVTNDYMECKAIVGDKPVYYRGMDITIPEGRMIGIDSIAGVNTEECVKIEIVFCYKMTEKETETPLIEWKITGDPELRLVVDNIKGEITTSSTLVNRIPDIIAAAPGFQTFLDMPKPHCTIGTMKIKD